ncbi:hypothetical protein PH210_13160 [Paenibacillus sp. BSR1-1]|uniref:hypothetical protein n=1 Tax=Paenibacillus sp. BSR1-1 TaxID=3020845 RepID=UPI0025B0E264|nr:hypothetical protein [Paenibacillus sp. BSR1-1]MDN3017142.1 hypothetical protein [Paenibacillus sp. BSR1-1]
MDLLGGLSVLIGLALIWGGIVYDREKHENDSTAPDVDSLIGAIITFLALSILRLLPYQVTKTLLFVFAFICFCFSVYAFTHLH